MWFLCSKKNFAWLWLLVNKFSKSIISHRLGDRSSGTLKQLLYQSRVETDIYCTDHYQVYNDVIPSNKLAQGKRYTYTVEGKNAQIRHYARMLNRKTKCYAKTFKSLNAVIAIVIQRINFGYDFNIKL